MKVTIQNDGPKLKLAGRVILMPGLTEVEADSWRVCLQHQMTRVFLDTKKIRVVTGPVVDPGQPHAEEDAEPFALEPAEPAEPTSMVSAKDMVSLVRQSTDQAYLVGLFETEKRTTVLVAINARLETLNKPASTEGHEA